MIQQTRSALKTLAAEVEAHDGDEGPGKLWDRFHASREDCRRLFREYLAFLEGALVRSAGLDGDACAMADALLDELSQKTGLEWPRFTILAEDELIAGMTDIIRLRFPQFSIWDLPIAAHELGHFVIAEARDRIHGGQPLRHLVEERLERERETLGPLDKVRFAEELEKTRFHLDEHFADLFAVYTLGPAYACTCLWLRFDPRAAYEEADRHPCDADRAYVLLRALEEIDRGLYQRVVDRLRESWGESVRAAGWPDRSEVKKQGWLEEILEEMLGALESNLPREARYGGWNTAVALRTRLLGRTRPGQADDGVEPSLADLLNAAWLARLEQEATTDRVGRTTLALALRAVRAEEEGNDA